MITTKEKDIAYRQQELMDALPDYYQESPEANAIMHGNAIEFERKRAEAQDLLNQLFVTTATWGLDYWDRVLDLPAAPRMDITKRRERIIVKLNGTAPATVENLTNILNAFSKNRSGYIIENAREYMFELFLPTVGEYNINAEDIYKAIDEVKPAHLGVFLNLVIGSIMTVVGKGYHFISPFPITNCFKTAEAVGRIGRDKITLIDRSYNFVVGYPITNVMYATGDDLETKGVMKIQVNTAVYKTNRQYAGPQNNAGEVTL